MIVTHTRVSRATVSMHVAVMPPPQQPSLPLATTRMTRSLLLLRKRSSVSRPHHHHHHHHHHAPTHTHVGICIAAATTNGLARPTPYIPGLIDHHIAHYCCTGWVGSLPPDLLSDRIRCDLCGACHPFMVMANKLVSGSDSYSCMPSLYPCIFRRDASAAAALSQSS